MPDSHERLHKAVSDELQKQRVPLDRAKVFGTFIDVALTNLGISRARFAKALDIEDELADAILNGLLPISELNDDLLADIAQVIQYEPDLLRVMLGQTTNPTEREGNVR